MPFKKPCDECGRQLVFDPERRLFLESDTNRVHDCPLHDRRHSKNSDEHKQMLLRLDAIDKSISQMTKLLLHMNASQIQERIE